MTAPGYRLAQSLADVDHFLENEPVHEDRVLAVDTESTGLNLRKAQMVGYSVCARDGVALYVPIHHKVGANVAAAPALERLRNYAERLKLKLLHYNAKHDRTVLQKETCGVPLGPTGLFDWNLGWQHPDFLDVIELVYLNNPDREEKGLKIVAKEDCGFEMMEFETNFSPEELAAAKPGKNNPTPIQLDISTKSPGRILDYVCRDVDGLIKVYAKHKTALRFALAIKTDTRLVDVVRRMEYEGGFVMDADYIKSQIAKLDGLAAELTEMIYRVAGHRFEIDSSKQLGEVLFDRLGLPSPGLTKGRNGQNQQHKTDEDSLDPLRAAHPIVEYIVSYKKVVKARGTYFTKMLRLHEEKIPVRFNFHTYLAPTFRFAAPGGKPERDGFSGLNIQAISDGEAREILAVDLMPRDAAQVQAETVDDADRLLDPDLPELGEAKTSREEWEATLKTLPYVISRIGQNHPVCVRETCKGCPASCAAQGVDTVRRPMDKVRIVPSARQAFKAPEGWTLAALDYDKQELVIGANISGEQSWIEAFLLDQARKKQCETCGQPRCKIKGHLNEYDLHSQTTCMAFSLTSEQFAKLHPEDAAAKRDVGKVVNFLVFYGGNNFTMANRCRLAQAVADQIYTEFKKRTAGLFSWISKVHRFARKEGYTTTYFGRERRLDWIYEKAKAEGNWKLAAFADRSAVNTCVQGTGAEVARIAMVRVADRLAKAGLSDAVKLVIMVHDELLYLIRNDVLEQALPIIKGAMQIFVKGWKVQLTVGCETGPAWGIQTKRHVELPEAVAA